MAHNNVEIEIKINVSESIFMRTREKLNKIATFVKKNRQNDAYYMPAHRNFVELQFPFEWLSIRKRGDAAILSYKHWYPENSAVTTHCDEFETKVENQEQLEKIFKALDIKPLVAVEKEREVYQFKDEFEISLDTVKDLGHFIEIESLKDFGSIEETRQKLFDFARELGVDASNPDLRGYPYLILKKNGVIK
ncbi:class IV adenylate cyclase [Candidatus Woesearchaeota archaeon]|nr:class IV adenylate cyclase [Candidatus Woesearchaeota archaeon]